MYFLVFWYIHYDDIDPQPGNYESSEFVSYINESIQNDVITQDEKIFAPDHPTTWEKNPTEWLSNIPNILLPINTDRLILHPLKAWWQCNLIYYDNFSILIMSSKLFYLIFFNY